MSIGAQVQRAPAVTSPGRRPRKILRPVLLYAAVALFALWILLPLWYALASSLTTPQQISVRPYPLIPGDLTLDNYRGVLTGRTGSSSTSGTTDLGSRLVPAIMQSVLVSSLLVLINLVIGSLAAYGLSRYPFRGSHSFHIGIVASRVVPGIAIVGPFFILFRNADLLNTPWALVISYNVFTLPLAIMVLTNYFNQLPKAVEEAAMMDGATRLQALWLIVVPLARPGLVAAGVLIFLESWSEFFYALVLTNQLTVPPLLAGFQSVQQFNWNALSAATIVALIPPVLLALVFQRQVVGALAAGFDK